jgi:hypothetical protein
MPRMRLRLLSSLLIALGAGLAVSGQDPSGALRRTIRSQDWAVSDWSAIRAGQLSIVHGRDGDHLQVNALTTIPRLAAPEHDRGAVPACDGNCFVVSAFDYGSSNRLGGFFGTFGKGHSTARTALDGWDDGRRALTIDFVNTATGPCGAWIHLFDLTRPAADRVYLDTTPLQIATFWIRGKTGGERVQIKAADAAWERREDALPIGDVGSFLPAGRITAEWQQAIVPLSAFPAPLDRRTLAVLVFEAVSGGESRIAIKDLGFCMRPQPAIPLSPPASPGTAQPPGERALWVWNTAEIIDAPAAQRALVEFARRGRITQLFLQLPDAPSQRRASGEIVLDATRWKAFLGFLGGSGLRAHALVGSPEDALPDHHERVLATVQNVVAYNAAAAPGDRFAGMHFDIEPYLLPGFRGTRRQQILAGYLDLVAKTAQRTGSAGIEFGVDIPFWYDSLDDLTGELPLVEYRGTRKPANEHVLDLVDSAAVMTYRTTAYGADSIVALAEGELRYAAAKGKRVFVGLETTHLPDEDLIEFDGAPGRGLPAGSTAGDTVVIEPGAGTGTVWVGPRAGWGRPRAKLDAGRPALPGPRSLWWPVRRTVAVPGAKLTFSHLGGARLDDAMRQVLVELGHRPSFGGFAIHDYLGYRALLAGSRPPG